MLPREYQASATVVAASEPVEQPKSINGSGANGNGSVGDNGSGAEIAVASKLPLALKDRMNGHSVKDMVPAS